MYSGKLEKYPMADSIQINLPDGSTKEVPKGTTALGLGL